MLSFAGLLDQWMDIEAGAAVKSATIIVTAANTLTRTVHDRMPVIFDTRDVDRWLTGETATAASMRRGYGGVAGA